MMQENIDPNTEVESCAIVIHCSSAFLLLLNWMVMVMVSNIGLLLFVCQLAFVIEID